MKNHLGIIIKATCLYWLGVWLTIIIMLLCTNGRDTFEWVPMRNTLLGFMLITLILSPLVWLAWMYSIKKFSYNKYLCYFTWNISPWFFLTCLCEWEFKIISGNITGLGEFRLLYWMLMLLSAFWAGMSFLFVFRKIKR